MPLASTPLILSLGPRFPGGFALLMGLKTPAGPLPVRARRVDTTHPQRWPSCPLVHTQTVPFSAPATQISTTI